MVHCCSALQRLIQTTKVTKLSFPVSQFSAALSCIPLLMTLCSYRLDQKLLVFPFRLPILFLFALLLPTSPQKGKVVDRSFCSGCLSYRCYTRKTWGQEFQSPSLLRCRESNTIKKTLARYFGKKGKRRCHLTS